MLDLCKRMCQNYELLSPKKSINIYSQKSLLQIICNVTSYHDSFEKNESWSNEKLTTGQYCTTRYQLQL